MRVHGKARQLGEQLRDDRLAQEHGVVDHLQGHAKHESSIGVARSARDITFESLEYGLSVLGVRVPQTAARDACAVARMHNVWHRLFEHTREHGLLARVGVLEQVGQPALDKRGHGETLSRCLGEERLHAAEHARLGGRVLLEQLGEAGLLALAEQSKVLTPYLAVHGIALRWRSYRVIHELKHSGAFRVRHQLADMAPQFRLEHLLMLGRAMTHDAHHKEVAVV
mmetsp:Transcript_45642/g.97232  ORF Transcript_45642/g.97232 Transcript_45642/m.97232 type:complete len:225 (-) Transcript_45642:687-1361(-)